jgi:hypothetical protein
MANNTPAGGELAGDLARVLDLLRQVPTFQRPVGGAIARSLDRTFFLTEKASAEALGRKAPIAGPIEMRRQLAAPVLEALRRCQSEPSIATLLSDRDADLLPDDAIRAAVEQLERKRLDLCARQVARGDAATAGRWLRKTEAAKAAGISVERLRPWCTRENNPLSTRWDGGTELVNLDDVLRERDGKDARANPTEAHAPTTRRDTEAHAVPAQHRRKPRKL